MPKRVKQINIISLKFMWNIHDFSKSCKKVGESIESPYFNGWKLQLYPKGLNANCENHLSIYLYNKKETKAKCVMYVINNNGEVVTYNISDEFVYGMKYGRGNGELIAYDFIVDPVNNVLKDDRLTIVCEITYTDNVIKKLGVAEQEAEDNNNYKDNYKSLLNDKTFSDVSLICEGKAEKVHKCILAKRSSVFAAMFSTEMKEKLSSTVQINDIKHDVLVEMIRYIYSGKVNNIDEVVVELALAADKYALGMLRNICEKTMFKNVNVDNVIKCLQVADKLDMKELKAKAIEFIIENGSDVCEKPEFDSLSHVIVREIFRSIGIKRLKLSDIKEK